MPEKRTISEFSLKRFQAGSHDLTVFILSLISTILRLTVSIFILPIYLPWFNYRFDLLPNEIPRKIILFDVIQV